VIRRALIVATIAAAVVGCAQPPAQAAGWVANSCGVKQSLHAVMAGPHPETGDGLAVRFIPCGSGTSGIKYVTAGPRPFYVNPEGPRAPFCMNAGQRYYPNGNGAVLTPTVRCN
jgi:hypothetical protein